MYTLQGNPRGLYGLGLLYLQGKGVTVNYGEAFRYFNKSAVKGWTSAKFQLGIMYYKRVNIFSKDHIYPLALLLWKRAAAQGNALARIKIGDYYFYGHGTERDLIAATTQYSLAANEHQSAQALFNLGYMIEHGLGIDKDIPLARKLYALAARASPEATIAFFVFFAILKLDILQFFRSLQLFNITDAMETLNITKTLLPYWDVVLITLIAALLLILLGNRLFRNYVCHLVLLFCTSNF
ncbi:hypothetical protein FKM82_010388 [Ascaphus truei]